MFRPTTVIALIMLSLCIIGLFQLKYHVVALRQDLGNLQQQVKLDQDSLHVLRAEWAYLNRPERIEYLVKKHLSVTPIMVSQVEPHRAIDDAKTRFAKAGHNQ